MFFCSAFFAVISSSFGLIKTRSLFASNIHLIDAIEREAVIISKSDKINGYFVHDRMICFKNSNIPESVYPIPLYPVWFNSKTNRFCAVAEIRSLIDLNSLNASFSIPLPSNIKLDIAVISFIKMFKMNFQLFTSSPVTLYVKFRNGLLSNLENRQMAWLNRVTSCKSISSLEDLVNLSPRPGRRHSFRRNKENVKTYVESLIPKAFNFGVTKNLYSILSKKYQFNEFSIHKLLYELDLHFTRGDGLIISNHCIKLFDHLHWSNEHDDMSLLHIDVNSISSTQAYGAHCLALLCIVIASDSSVKSVGVLPVLELQNDVTRGITQCGFERVEPFSELGLDGSGVIVGVADTGVDENSCFFVENPGQVPVQRSSIDHAIVDIKKRKIVQYVNYSGSGDILSGHGTHVTGTIAGSCINCVGTDKSKTDMSSYKGIASGAKIAFFDILPATGFSFFRIYVFFFSG